MKRSNTTAIARPRPQPECCGDRAWRCPSCRWSGSQPGWLTVIRFGLAALLLAFPARAHLRAAFTPAILLWGVFGVGVTRRGPERRRRPDQRQPRLDDGRLDARSWSRSSPRSGTGTGCSPQAWVGLAVSLVGVAVVAGGGGGQSSMFGDGLVLFSLAISAAMTVAQVDMLRGRDPMAVTAVQFMAAAAGALPIALRHRGRAGAPVGGRPDARRPRPDRRRDDAAVGALRVRPGPGARRRGGVVPQHRAARRRRCWARPSSATPSGWPRSGPAWPSWPASP